MVNGARTVLASGLVLWTAGLGGCFPTDRPVASDLVCDDSGCSCMPNRGNCDGSPHNGCEADLLFDARHCGSCDIRCGHGQCVEGVCEAAEGYVDCNDSMVDGFEAHLDTDSHHCGACGQDCLGGTCSDGECQPFRPVDAGYDVWGLASDQTHVYFCEDFSGTILRIAQAGGAPEVLAYDQPCENELAAAGGYVYWAVWPSGVAAPELIFEVSTEGQGLHIMANSEYLRQLVAADDVVAWIDRRDIAGVDIHHIVARADPSATPQVVYAAADDDAYIESIAVDGGDIYWIETTLSESLPPRINRVSATGGGVTELVARGLELATVDSLQVRDGVAYWREIIDDPDRYHIARLDTQTLESELLHVTEWNVDHLVADGAGLFWSEADGRRLLSLPSGADEVVLLADFLEIDQITVGPQAIFWYDWPDKLLALAK